MPHNGSEGEILAHADTDPISVSPTSPNERKHAAIDQESPPPPPKENPVPSLKGQGHTYPTLSHEQHSARTHPIAAVNRDIFLHPSAPLSSVGASSGSEAEAATPQPTTTQALSHRLAGAWTLQSYMAHPVKATEGVRATFPMTRAVRGIMLYSPDGFMSTQMQIPGQDVFDPDDPASDEDDEPWAEAAKRLVSYSGPFWVTKEGEEGRLVLRHGREIAMIPSLAGYVEIRTWRFEGEEGEEGELLVLGTEEGKVQGEIRRPEWKWRRTKHNVGATPPERLS